MPTPLGGGVGDRAAWSAKLVVEADAGCERAAWGAGAVAFKGEQVFAGPEDGLDPLSDRGEVRPRLGFGLSRRPQDDGAEVGDA
jgi:hypothetical protein